MSTDHIRPWLGFKKIETWQAVFELCLMVTQISKSNPTSEVYGLVLQTRRSAVSVVSNIAEGYGRGSLRDYLRHLAIARGSLFELDTQLELAESLGYTTGGLWIEKLELTPRLLSGLIVSLGRKHVRELVETYGE